MFPRTADVVYDLEYVVVDELDGLLDDEEEDVRLAVDVFGPAIDTRHDVAARHRCINEVFIVCDRNAGWFIRLNLAHSGNDDTPDKLHDDGVVVEPIQQVYNAFSV